MEHHLSEEERAKVGMMADMVIDLVAKRYGLTVSEAVDAIHWVRNHKEFVSKLKHGGWMTLFGVLISAALLSAWEGFKAIVRMKS